MKTLCPQWLQGARCVPASTWLHTVPNLRRGSWERFRSRNRSVSRGLQLLGVWENVRSQREGNV